MKSTRAAPSDPANARRRPSAGELALEHFLDAGFERIEPPILQPASVFLDMSGEEIRGRLYLTSDASGAEQCLRPEYTVPVCLAYLASPKAGGIAEYSYLGPVFRAQVGQAGEKSRPGSRASAAPTRKPPTPKSSRSVSRPPPRRDRGAWRCGWATPAFSNACSPRSRCPTSGCDG